ncbi:MAG: alcohol dehydrogenase catalytic domain-containing protein [Proteobacteria bacterium]|nr:alcohol dehydrogenase catalytic domain-containing protein [Pseudomonadota bacterium]NIS72561.1 alcohol dehydrogenase catalytic domain-containing protein [Pseudomonadota bacterium]
MLAATYTQGGHFQLEDIPVPKIQEDEILVRVRATSICGTDLRIIQHGHRKLQPGQKIVLGHEFSGTVEAVGSRVRGYKVGQRVGVAPNIGCGQCDQCVEGRANMCPDYSAFGINFDGTHTEFARVPGSAISQGNVMALPEEVSFDEAALNEPFSCVINGNDACRIKLGDTVLIFGAGPIGLLHLILAKLSGAKAVIVSDVIDEKLDRATRMGADHVINPKTSNLKKAVLSLTHGEGANVIVTACPVHSVQEQSFELAASFGRICFFGGLPHERPKITINSNLIHYRNLIVTGVTGGSNMHYRAGLKLLASRKVDLTPIVSGTYPLSRATEAFQMALSGRAMKIILKPSG